jgi:hypothetical protein
MAVATVATRPDVDGADRQQAAAGRVDTLVR